MHRIFVYGTLRRGMPNHELIASSCFLGPAATTERFRMIAESFPVLLSCRDGLAVAGELYEVDTQTLGRLDHLERVREGGGGSYERRATDVHYWDGKKLVASLAELYVGNPSRWQTTHWQEWRITNSVGHLEWPRATS
jgi:gamma-glutamylcyclotransferase (GGCT)/AIG2-like uncharacterized protein YtfP